jgi:hypothetical protein
MMGIGAQATPCTITPQGSTRIFVIFTGNVRNTANNAGANIILRYGTGTAPINGAAQTGTQASGPLGFTAAAPGQQVPFAAQSLIGSLTIGTTYWIDLSLNVVTGGTASITQVSCSAFEV